MKVTDSRGTAATPRILVLGGAGYFGRLLVAELLQYTECHLIIGGRDQGHLLRCCDSLEPPLACRLTPKIMDLTRPETIEPALETVRVTICAAGPFQTLPTTLVKLCLDRRVHYIDLSDDRGFVRNVRQIVQERGNDPDFPAVCTGWSAVSALSGVLARIGTDGMDRVDAIYIHIAPGNRSPRSNGTVASLLASVGETFTVWQDGTWQTVTGWSQPRVFRFPAPVGDRIGYLVDVPDHELFPPLFGADRVEFRVGSELGFLNRGLDFLAWTSRRGLVRNWTPWVPFFRHSMALFGLLGSNSGAVGIEVVGRKNSVPCSRRVSVVADQGGQRIPVMPAVIMAKALLTESSGFHGLVPVDSWLTQDQLQTECERRDYRLVIEEEPLPAS